MHVRVIFFLFIICLFQLNNYPQRVSIGNAGDREYYSGLWKGDSIFYTNTISIRIQEGVTISQLLSFLETYNAEIRFNYFQEFGWGSVDLPSVYDALAVIQEWENLGIFENVQPVRVITSPALVNDPEYLSENNGL